jgi:uncharacterized membrane protein YoaK (UPF0700 family)
MSSLDIAASPPIRRDETVQVSLLLAFVAFGAGAAVGAYATKSIRDLALGIPLLALLIVLFQCEVRSDEERT